MRNLLYIVLAFFIMLLAFGAIANKAFGQNYQRTEAQPLHFSEHPQHADVHELSTGGGVYVLSGDSNNIPTPPEESLGDAVKRMKLTPKRTSLECQNAMHREVVCQ